MAKYSKKIMGKEVGDAATYAEPHTMKGGKFTIQEDSRYTPGSEVMKEMNPSVGGISKGNYKPTKTDGIKIRGTGAATKGVMARGPMG
jgi:hypothetical protein